MGDAQIRRNQTNDDEQQPDRDNAMIAAAEFYAFLGGLMMGSARGTTAGQGIF
jgi:hypothetical protein